MDSANYVTMLLLDKGYFDYDYQKVDRQLRWEDTIIPDDELKNRLAGFGIGVKKKPTTPEELQEYIIKQEGYGS